MFSRFFFESFVTYIFYVGTLSDTEIIIYYLLLLNGSMCDVRVHNNTTMTSE